MSTRILLITHAPLAEALRACALHVFPDCAGDLLVLDVPPQEPPEDTLAHARALLAQGGGAQAPTLVLSDMLGATPCNVAQRLVEGMPAQRLVCGVNLPMLIEMCSAQLMDDGSDIKDLMQKAVDAGKNGTQTFHASSISDDDEEDL